jgi:alpha-tubulin suppressor-like RCC1 family protein
MKIVSVSEDQYAILTRARDPKIISWLKKNVEYNGRYEPPLIRVYTKDERKWVEFLQGGCLTNFGGSHIRHTDEISDDLALKMENIKTIVSTNRAFAVLLNNGEVFAWGDKEFGGLIPTEIQSQLKHIKMIYSNIGKFVAVSENGKAYSWPCDTNPFLRFPSDIVNVKMIISTDMAFAALLNDGSVCNWGSIAGQTPDDCDLKNVKIIFSNKNAFIALFQDGGFISWGDPSGQELLKKLVSPFYDNANK